MDAKGKSSRNPNEVSPDDYYAGLSTWDAYRVSLFINIVKRASDSSQWDFAVMAYGSAAKPRERAIASDLDLRVIATAKQNEDRSEADNYIRQVIRDYYRELSTQFEEKDRTFKIWGEDDTVTLPLHVFINSEIGASAQKKISLERTGDKPFALLLAPPSLKN